MMSRGEWQSNCTSEEGEWLLEVERAGIGCRLYKLQGVPVPMTTRYTFSSGERGGQQGGHGGALSCTEKITVAGGGRKYCKKKKDAKKKGKTRERERERVRKPGWPKQGGRCW